MTVDLIDGDLFRVGVVALGASVGLFALGGTGRLFGDLCGIFVHKLVRAAFNYGLAAFGTDITVDIFAGIFYLNELFR